MDDDGAPQPPPPPLPLPPVRLGRRPPPGPAPGLGSAPVTPAAAPRAPVDPSDDGAGPSQQPPQQQQGRRKRRKPGEAPRTTKELNLAFTKRKAGLAAAAATLAGTTDAATFVFVASRTGTSWAFASPGMGAALDADLLAALRRATGREQGDGATKIMDGAGKVVAEVRGGGGGGGGEPAVAAANDDDDDDDLDLDEGESLAELDAGAVAAAAPAAPADAAWLLGRE